VALVAQSEGNYQFLPGSGALPFCSGVVADSGYEIVHATLRRPIPWREGFALVERHLAALGRPRQALCAVELRCGKQYTREQFFAPHGFNVDYGELLRGWGLFVDGMGSTARTNIAVDLHPFAEQVLFAFSYTVPARDAPPTFVVSGAPEGPTVHPGDTSPDALRAKTADIVATLGQRLASLDLRWDQATAVGLYTVHDLFPFLRAEVLEKMGLAGLNGIQWFHGRPPTESSEIELDVRGIQTELRVGES